MDVEVLFLVRELVQRVDHLTAVPLPVLDVLGRAHDREVQLTPAGADVVPVDELDVGEFAAVQHAVLDGHRLAAAEEAGAQMSVGVQARVVPGLVDVAAVVGVHRAGMAILMLL